jgi:hypothetical protein
MKYAFALLMAVTLQASTVVTLDPVGGALSGAPGDTVGWGFTLNNTNDFLEISQTDFCVSATQASDLPCASQVSSFGTYTDFTPLNFFVVGPGGTVTQVYDPITPTGFGSFTINGSATPGTVLNGEIAVVFQLFDGDPANGGNMIGGDNFISSPASIAVVDPAAVPEPGTMGLFGLGAAGLIALGRRAQKSVLL